MTTHPIPFTSEVPKVPGAYWVKRTDTDQVLLVLVRKREAMGDLMFSIDNELFFGPQEFKDCQWCHLSPTSTLKTAVKEAWEEGLRGNPIYKEQLWAESNARKIVEGEE